MTPNNHQVFAWGYKTEALNCSYALLAYEGTGWREVWSTNKLANAESALIQSQSLKLNTSINNLRIIPDDRSVLFANVNSNGREHGYKMGSLLLTRTLDKSPNVAPGNNHLASAIDGRLVDFTNPILAARLVAPNGLLEMRGKETYLDSIEFTLHPIRTQLEALCNKLGSKSTDRVFIGAESGLLILGGQTLFRYELK